MPAASETIVGARVKCCKCNAAGRCANCCCAKNGTKCVNCTPGGKSTCNNGGNRYPFATMLSDETGGLDHGKCGAGAGVGANNAELNEDLFRNTIASAYERVVHWRRNLFNVPYGAAGAAFFDELVALIKGFAEAEPVGQIAWKAVCVACHLLLQRPSSPGSASAFSKHLERRLGLWRSKRIDELIDESICIQDHLPIGNRRKNAKSNQSDTVFAKLVYEGKINSATRCICEESSGGVLGMDDQPLEGSVKTVRDI